MVFFVDWKLELPIVCWFSNFDNHEPVVIANGPISISKTVMIIFIKPVPNLDYVIRADFLDLLRSSGNERTSSDGIAIFVRTLETPCNVFVAKSQAVCGILYSYGRLFREFPIEPVMLGFKMVFD